MYYERKILHKEMDSLLGESIKSVFYYTDYEGYETFTQLSDSIVEVPLLGILLETSSGSFYNISSFDYAPYYGLGGVRVFRDKAFTSPQGRPNQINEVFWNHFRDKKIINHTILESYYKKTEDKLTIPFGLKIVFEDGEECYIMNMCIEDFIEEKGIYDFCRGGELVLFAGKNTFDQYLIMQENMFDIGNDSNG